MSHARRIATAVLSAAVVGLSAACGAVTNDSGGAAAGGTAAATGDFTVAPWIKEAVDKGEKLQIRLSYHDPSLAFAVPIKSGMTKAAQELGVDAQMVGPTGGNAAQQVAELQTLINQKKVHGIAVSSASNDALKPVIKQAHDAGIPIISFNTNNPDSDQMAFVGQDLVASGRALAGELVKSLDGRKGKVVVVTVDSGAGWSNDRFTGFSEGMKDSGAQLVGPISTGNEPSASYNTIESAMGGHKDAVAIASLDCCSFTAGAKWVQQAGRAGKMKVVGFDVQPQTVDFIKSGVATFTISQGPADQGYQAVKVIADFLTKGTPVKDVDTGVKVATKDTIASFPVEG